jgi:hypothetical protein
VVVKVDAQAAREAAFQMLGHTGDRWLHPQAAAAAATRAATTVVEEDRGLLIAAAWVHADLTSGPDGRPMMLERRLADIQRRHAADPVHLCEARRAQTPHLIGAYYRVVNRMDQSEEVPWRGLVGASEPLPRALSAPA